MKRGRRAMQRNRDDGVKDLAKRQKCKNLQIQDTAIVLRDAF